MELDSSKNEAKNDLKRMDIDIEVRQYRLTRMSACIQRAIGGSKQIVDRVGRASHTDGRGQVG